MAERKSSKAGAPEINPFKIDNDRPNNPWQALDHSESLEREDQARIACPGRERKTTAQKQSSLKHDPYAEFRASPYTLKEPHHPTYLRRCPRPLKPPWRLPPSLICLGMQSPNRSSRMGRGQYTPLDGSEILHGPCAQL